MAAIRDPTANFRRTITPFVSLRGWDSLTQQRDDRLQRPRAMGSGLGLICPAGQPVLDDHVNGIGQEPAAYDVGGVMGFRQHRAEGENTGHSEI